MNMQESIQATIADRIYEIKSLLRLGWSRKDALAHVRRTSTLGPKSWAAILAGVPATEAEVKVQTLYSADGDIRVTVTTDYAQNTVTVSSVCVSTGSRGGTWQYPIAREREALEYAESVTKY